MIAGADTIVAIATAPGRGAVGIVRLSGSDAFTIARRLSGGALPPPRQAGLRRLRDAKGREIDRGLLLCFPAPASFTGEDVVELQGHGGPVLLEALQAAAVAAGARRARPGEFTERAFLNDRIDLAQAEAIADLINAQSLQAARAAQRSLDGVFSGRVQVLVEALIGVRSFVEGALDFSDEDLDWLGDAQLSARLRTLESDLAALLAETRRGARLRDGLVVVLAGPPNVGKSTLLNRLAGREAAIVTEIPGTTRDLLREDVVLDGLPLTVVDTAGLRDSADPVEREGVRRARAMLEKAELVLYVVDDREPPPPRPRVPEGAHLLVLRNKTDLSGKQPGPSEQGWRISAADGAGIDAVVDEIKRLAGHTDHAESAFSARARHVEALRDAAAHLAAARALLDTRAQAELAAEELRLAQQALSEITGAFSSDELLGRIFGSFCIGK